MKAVSKISAKALASLLRNNAKMALYDVADSGVIKKAINLPFYSINQNTIESIVKSSVNEKLDNVVCCCKFGKVRSVITANKIAEEMSKLKPIPKTEVSFLDGGLELFGAYPENSDLIDPVLYQVL